MKKIILILITILFATNVLTAPVTITLGKLPTVKIAFGATAAIGWGYGAAGTGGHCTSSSNATGLFGAEPSVIITFQ